MDGVIVPALPHKTLMANDDPTSAAIERRRHSLAVLVARVAAHPVMRTSADLQIFLEVRTRKTSRGFTKITPLSKNPTYYDPKPFTVNPNS